MLPVQHGDVAPAARLRQRLERLLDPLDDDVRLVLLIRRVGQIHERADVLDRLEWPLLEPLLVVVDQPARRREDVAGGPAVLDERLALYLDRWPIRGPLR